MSRAVLGLILPLRLAQQMKTDTLTPTLQLPVLCGHSRMYPAFYNSIEGPSGESELSRVAKFDELGRQ